MSDYDKNINYKTFYGDFLSGVKHTGNEMIAKCPFHEDKHASMSINTESGIWLCHACGKSGNAQVFLEQHEGLSPQQAVSKLKKEAGIIDFPSKKFDVEEYARLKKIPKTFLEELRITDNKKAGISIPYMDESGAIVATRQRFSGQTGLKFTWVRGSKVHLYGLWKLPEIRKKEYVFLVEGESDAQTLWLYGVPCLGVPGASTFQDSWTNLLMGIDVYIHKEPDIGGETFVKKICEALVIGKHDGQIKSFQIPGYKDPSSLHMAIGKNEFIKTWETVIAEAETINTKQLSINVDNLIENAPILAKPPAGWRCDIDRGVSMLNDKGLSVLICPVPVLLSKRLRSIDTGDEKIELTFKRDNKWHTVVTLRSIVFQTRTITSLADKGLPITSEKAAQLVKYLGDFEAENLDILPLCKSTEKLGWVSNTKFLPGLADDILLDIDSSMNSLADGYSEHGDLDSWKKVISQARKNHIARFIIAAAFAAPLMKPLNHRVFIVHNWGDTRSGKTAALKAALSVWGDPDVLMANFNATRVGLERIASFYNDLPLGIDERQVLGDKQGFIDSLIYLLGLGKGKTRGAKMGGIQQTNTWRCLVLTTGEDPLIADNSLGGIRTRVLELYGRTFPKEEDARGIHQICSESYGHAGTVFVKGIIQSLKENDGFLKKRFDSIYTVFSQKFPNNLEPHLSAVTLVALADVLSSIWIFQEDPALSLDIAIKMGNLILESLDTLESADTGDRAWQYVKGWLIANTEKFKKNCAPPRYGFIDGVGNFCVIPSFLERTLIEAGYNYRKTMNDFVDKNYIQTETIKGKITHLRTLRPPDATGTAKFVVVSAFEMEVIHLDDDDNDDESRLPF